jgi:putative transposase
MQPNNSNDRMMRGAAIAEKKTIAENADGSFAVPSQTVDEIVYRVLIVDNVWACNCPDHTSRKVECKHIHATRIWIASRTEIQEKPRPKVFAEDALQCPCGSIRVVRFGHANGKQIFKCRDCGRKFRESLLRKSRYTPETIALTLDLYFSGDSLTKIARILNSHLDMHIGKATVYRWIQRYVPQISEYVNSLSPQLSDT